MNKEGENKMKNNLAEDLEPKKISYAELLEFDDEKRYELIDGVPYLMASPRVAHQDILGELYYQLKTYLKGKTCRVFASPLDVKLSGEKDNKKEFNVVQPDIMVVCDQNKITEKNIQGAPDLAIEITSPNNPAHDKLVKLNLYQKFGVKEYWIVSLEEQIISVFLLNEDKSTVEFREATFGVTLKAPNAVDVGFFASKFICIMEYSVVVVAVQNKAIAGFPTVRVNC